MNIAFAGFKHMHIVDLYTAAQNNTNCNIVGSFEDDAYYRKSAEQRGINFNYESFDSLLADNSDTVAIGDFFANRGTLAIKALEAGKNVICDKPMCTSLEELDRIEVLAKEKRLYVSCMFTMRYEGITEAAKEAVKLIGDVKSVYFGGQHPLLYPSRPKWYFENGKYGGLINDLAIHGIDLVYYLCGLRITDIKAARCYNAFAKKDPDFLDSGQFMATLSNGAGLIADVSYSVPDAVNYALPYYWTFYFWGENGMFSFSLGADHVTCFTANSPLPRIIKKAVAPVDFLSDFLALTKGEKSVLTTEEAISSTRDTLKIQKFSEKQDL